MRTLLPLLLLTACVEHTVESPGRACWKQHQSYEICYTKCAALNPRYRSDAETCVKDVDDEAMRVIKMPVEIDRQDPGSITSAGLENAFGAELLGGTK